ILLEKLIPGEYDNTVTSADGSEIKNIRVTVIGCETSQCHIQLWSITTVLTLDDDSKVYGMLLGKNENGDILFSAEKGKSSAYKIDQVTAIDKSSLQDKFGFNTGIELRTDRFKPILATIHDEADERDFTELEEEAEDAGSFTSSQINTDSNALDLIEFQSKYKNKKISITGTVSMIREGESKFSIVIDDNIECYLEKTDDLQKQQLVKRLNKQITISGFCLGLRGLDKVVIENSRVNK
ncbi:MAG: hypothetical protein HRT88_13605, partial [Lentisphaeraceae bacterium]|nr:hypothetical protein [Lentisphaeraceae bacterium]